VFGLGALQRLAEEMTVELQETRDAARARACAVGTSGPWPLQAKGTPFGSIRATRTASGPSCDVTYDTSKVEGVSPDLVVRPYQWKGNFAFLRDFNRDATHNEIGMQAVEITGDGVDGDGDGVTDEASVGDMTALAVYLAAQPRPTSKLELANLGLIDPLPADEVGEIQRGAAVFSAIGCASCHAPAMRITDPVFREPSALASFRDATFPAGQDPVARGVDPRFPVKFDLTRDQPDNQITDESGTVTMRLGSLRKDPQGRALAEVFGDLKRHNMGAGLAEAIDETGTGAATFLTENLWGVGSTAPYLHDGRATTLAEAILEHGGEAAASRAAFRQRGSDDQRSLIAFLNNLVLFKMVKQEVVVAPPATAHLKPWLHRRLHRR
jgi:hypothetical protein